MERILLDADWGFAEGTPPAIFTFFKDFEHRVNLPHDITVAQPPKRDCPEGEACGFMPGTLGTYMKFFNVPDEWLEKRIYLELDGAFCNTDVNLNGHQIGFHPNGYTPYAFDLTERIQAGENRLTVFVNNTIPRNTRWYMGTGIYRHAYLRVAPQMHLSLNPLFLRTEQVSGNRATILAEVLAENHTDTEKKLHAGISLFRDNGRGNTHSESCEAYGECDIYMPAHGKGVGRVRIAVENAALWDIESPNLYVVKVAANENGMEIDRDETLFGIRTITIDPVNGFTLNGRSLKLKGGCVHHDNGILGAVSLYDAEFRRLKKHKENGFNAIRGAHNPMSREMMEACDRLGLLFFAEAFDVWSMQKNANDYHLFFADWWERDLFAFIERDRNHPCIFCWSIGNEITERNDVSGGAETCAVLAQKVRSLDDTRFVTSAVPSMFNGLSDADARMVARELTKWQDFQNGLTAYTQSVWGSRTEGYCAPLDFVGYNYLEMRYEQDAENYPSRVICGTESFADRIADIWEIVEHNAHVIGDFVWTSWDYLGEAWIGMYYCKGDETTESMYPARVANCACFDIIGDERPALAFHRIAWGSKETYVATHDPKEFGKEIVKSAWSWCGAENVWYYPGQEGKPLTVDVYTSAPYAELIVNGTSLGKKRVGIERKNAVSFSAVYASGEVVAISYNATGKEISRQVLKTPQQVFQINLQADNTTISADGESLAFVEVTLVDCNGERVPVSDIKLTASVSGAATLAGFGSAAPSTEEVYASGEFTVYRGRALAVLRAGYEQGKSELTVSCDGLECKKITVTVK